MNSVSLMKWNGKPPLQWDWESLIMFNATTENTKQLRATYLETDGERGADSGFFCSSGSASRSGSCGSSSDLELASLSKSSKSASFNSSLVGDVKTSKFTLEVSKANPSDDNKREFANAMTTVTSTIFEASVGSGDPLLGLKLGRRTCFEDACAGNNTQSSSFSVIPVLSVNPTKKLKSSNQGQRAPLCQVEGCSHDLSAAKYYHRKHRVCESHSKSPNVIVAGLERRFCQQCSRFHSLSEFDEKKRSCRRRLSDHNARRRKQQPGSFHLNPSRLSSTLYDTDERQRMSFLWAKETLMHTRPSANLTWEGTSTSKFPITKELVVWHGEEAGTDEWLHLIGSDRRNTIDVQHCQKSNGFQPSKAKGTAAEVLNQGFEESIISSNMDATADLHRALSLLSTDSWGSCESHSISLEQPMHTNHTSLPQSVLHVIPQTWPHASSSAGRWSTSQPT